MDKKMYENPSVEVVELDEMDVIATSDGTDTNDNGLIGDIDLGL